MFKKIDHIEIVPSNMDRTIEFYTKILEFNTKSRRKMEGAQGSFFILKTEAFLSPLLEK